MSVRVRLAEVVEAAPVALAPAYLEKVEEVERLPSNQDGADKSWVWEALRRNRAHFERAQRV